MFTFQNNYTQNCGILLSRLKALCVAIKLISITATSLNKYHRAKQTWQTNYSSILIVSTEWNTTRTIQTDVWAISKTFFIPRTKDVRHPNGRRKTTLTKPRISYSTSSTLKAQHAVKVKLMIILLLNYSVQISYCKFNSYNTPTFGYTLNVCKHVIGYRIVCSKYHKNLADASVNACSV